MVPTDLAHGFRLFICPDVSYSSLVAVTAFTCRVIIVISDKAQREFRASPLKPNVPSVSRSSYD